MIDAMMNSGKATSKTLCRISEYVMGVFKGFTYFIDRGCSMKEGLEIICFSNTDALSGIFIIRLIKSNRNRNIFLFIMYTRNGCINIMFIGVNTCEDDRLEETYNGTCGDRGRGSYG